jgi:CubicO group peptidase (beta-lactamase class C family)
MLKRILKTTSITLLALMVLITLVILFSGRWYLFKGLQNTYLQGRSGPSATEYTIFDNRRIEALNPGSLVKSRLYNTARLPQDIEETFRNFSAHAFVIIKNDSLIHEQYWDGFSDTSHTNSFSMAKTYVSALLGRAIKDGYIKSIEEPVSKFISEFSSGEKSRITLKHLVTMTSGIDFDESYINPFAYPAEGYYGSDLKEASCHQGVCEQPGQTFKYLSGNTALLGMCITKAVGKPLSQYLSESLWKDLQCQQTAWWSLDKKDGYEKGFCCINSNALDFARLGMLYLNSGKWNGKQVLDSEFVANSVVPFSCKEEDGIQNCTYGYSWWLTKYNNKEVFYARGILGQYIICLPSEKLVVVKLARKRRPNGEQHYPADVASCIEAATKMYR